MGRIAGAPSPDAAGEAAVRSPPPPPRPLASSLFAVRRGRQPLDLEEAGSAAAYVTTANEFLTGSGNALGNATRQHHKGEDGRKEGRKEGSCEFYYSYVRSLGNTLVLSVDPTSPGG